VQWRQLVELVARGAGTSDPALLDRALERIAVLSSEVPDAVRLAAAKAIAGPVVPRALLAVFLDRPEVAAPLLAAAQLDDADWAELSKKAAPQVREMINAQRSSEHGGGTAKTGPAELSVAEVRQAPAAPSNADPPGLFRWECGPTGEIDWIEGAARAALIGRSLAEDFGQRFAARLPFQDETLVVAREGEMAGEWRWSGTPAFFPDTGRFAGYHGSARRGPAEDPGASEVPVEAPSLDSDHLRELIHELRTPLNAIIGFGEIIEGQILGPAHRAYRDRAAEIVRQARRLVAAVDDLDLAAKLQSGRLDGGDASSLDELLADVARVLEPQLAAKRIRLKIEPPGPTVRTALQHDLATRLLNRFVDVVLGAAIEGEELSLRAERQPRLIAVSLSRPRALRGAGEQELLDPTFTAGGDSGLGTGFALRLVRGLVIVAGGRLDITADRFSLHLPAARS
jgi:signal transduction histidine kinase